MPELTRPELAQVEQGLRALPAGNRRQIADRIAALPTTGPVVCPFLDTDVGTCVIYESRAVACRTYGFYVERDRGLYCTDIERRVSAGEFVDAIWGNHCSVDAELDLMGPRMSLRDLEVPFDRRG